MTHPHPPFGLSQSSRPVLRYRRKPSWSTRRPFDTGLRQAQSLLRANGRIIRDKLLAWPVPLAVLLLWWIAARYEWIAPQVLPSPEAVALTLRDSLVSGELWSHLQISLIRVQ